MLPLQTLERELKPGARVLVHGGPAESSTLHALLEAQPALTEGVTFCGLLIPGVSRFDYAGLHERARVETIFANPALRASFEAGRLDLLPIHYSLYPAHLERCPADLAILHLPPAQDGVFSCGLAADVAEGVKRYARRVAVLVNPALPFTPGGVALRADEADLILDAPAALAHFPSEAPDAGAERIAAHVAPLVRDGDCVQIGIGKVPSAILRALDGHRHLTLFGGMIVDEVAMLAARGALAPGCSITTGVAIGSGVLHDFLREGRAAFRGVAHTHSALEIARLENFISINSAIEVDLFGAVNSETVKGRPISGVGGGADFMRGARLARGGRSLIALNAEAKGLSRIVARLAPGATSVARADIDAVVTEYGVASLRDLSMDQRAEALIGIAAPEHRARLADEWRALRAAM